MNGIVAEEAARDSQGTVVGDSAALKAPGIAQAAQVDGERAAIDCKSGTRRA